VYVLGATVVRGANDLLTHFGDRGTVLHGVFDGCGKSRTSSDP